MTESKIIMQAKGLYPYKTLILFYDPWASTINQKVKKVSAQGIRHISNIMILYDNYDISKQKTTQIPLLPF